ncbi:hypothetical protein VAEU17_230131 [Vibrio aestuarianus]|nr:hypothetical protein VAEU17_230131 [Vibrio aestuarianus]
MTRPPYVSKYLTRKLGYIYKDLIRPTNVVDTKPVIPPLSAKF